MPDGEPRHYCIECESHFGVAAFETNRPDRMAFEFQRCDACAGFDDDYDAVEWLAFLLNRGYLKIDVVLAEDGNGGFITKMERDGIKIPVEEE